MRNSFAFIFFNLLLLSNLSSADLQIESKLLFNAVRNGNINMVSRILKEKSIDINKADDYGYTPLHLAVRSNNSQMAKLLIENGAKVNSTDLFCDTPLIDAVKNDNEEIARLLVCNNAKRALEDTNEQIALDHASSNKNLDMVLLLTQKDISFACKPKAELKSEEDIIGAMRELEGSK